MFRIKKMTLPKYEENTFTTQNYIIGPFLRGQTTTILTAIRRMMLIEIEGIAPIAIRIPNVCCEYETAEGVQEDVLRILLRLKQIIITGKIEDSTFRVLRLNVGKLLKEETSIPITAEDLELPLSLRVVNPDAVLATTIGSKTLRKQFYVFNQLMMKSYNWEILVGRGKGYITTVDLINQIPEDFLPLSNSFSPIEKLGYKYESNILGMMENAVVNLQTNGSISPEIAFSIASLYLINTFLYFRDQIYLASIQEELDPYNRIAYLKSIKSKKKNRKLFSKTQKVCIKPGTQKSQKFEPEEIFILLIRLSKRSRKVISNLRINSVTVLKSMSYEELLKISGCGKKSATEIIKEAQNFI